MSSIIADWKQGIRQRLLWIDFEQYAWRVFAFSAEDWYRNPVRYAGTLSQALRVIRSDVVAIDALAPFTAAWRSASTADLGDALPSRLIEFLSEQHEPLAFVADVIDALSHSIGSRADLVVKLRSPRDWLLSLGAADELASDFAVLDDVSTALVGLIRGLSNKALAGVQLSCAAPGGVSADEQDAYAPILKAAEYYGWATSVSYENATAVLVRGGFHVALFPEMTAEQLATSGDGYVGGGLTSEFWLGSGALLSSDLRLLHGAIPVEAVPERVTEKMQAFA